MPPIPPLTFTGGASGPAYGGANYGAPSFAGGGVWNVATSGSKASNSGSATAGGGASDQFSQYLPLALGGLALVIAWKLLKR